MRACRYEAAHAEVLPACIARRLAPHGLCIVALAIRWQSLFDQFAGSLARRGLRLHVHRLQLPPDLDLEGASSSLHAWSRHARRLR